MKIDEAIGLERKLFERRIGIREKKGHDYATSENVHENFDTIAQLCKLFKIDMTKPHGVAFLYKLLKLQREANLLFNNKTPANEPIVDTLLDLANYNDLELEILIRDGIIKLED
jgi:NADH:ubiquinone oxidoreductase subunit C